jgi:hypothetical protein
MSESSSIEIQNVFTDLPASGVIPVLLIGIVGLLLWLAGHRVLRTGIAGLGFVCGLALGWIVVDVLGRPVEPWFGGCVTGIMFALIGAFASKLIISVAMAALLALASPLITLSIAEFGGLKVGENSISARDEDSDHDSQAEPSSTKEGDDDADSGLLAESDELNAAIDILMTDQQGKIDEIKSRIEVMRERLPEIDAGTQGHIDHVQGVAADVLDALWSRWTDADQRLRLTLLASALIGGLLGLLFGTLSPRFSGSIVTALAGSLIVLVCAWIVLMRAQAPWPSWLPASPVGWSICWMCTAIIGLSIQWTFRRRPADRAA